MALDLDKKGRSFAMAVVRWVTLHSILVVLAGAVVASLAVSAPVAAVESSWQQAYKVRSRVVAGGRSASDAKTRLAFVEIELEPGWKTYWRHPGDGGGIPPEFRWDGSKNLASANVLYPAPQRLKDPVGDTVGYKTRVVFPVELKAETLSQDIGLNLALTFGICKDICVPTEAKLNVDVPPEINQSPPAYVSASLDAVPRQGTQIKTDDPVLLTIGKAEKKGDNWRVELRSKHAAGAKDADLFLEAPAGLFIPLPAKVSSNSDDQDQVAFEISLSDGEYQALKGQKLTATVVDSHGASQSGLKFQ